MATTVEKVVKGNYSCARIAKVAFTPNTTTEVASLGTAITFVGTMNVTPNPGAPSEIAYTEKKTSKGVTLKAQNETRIVKASDGTAASSGSEATVQIQMMTSPAKRKTLSESARAGDVYTVMAPSGLLANGTGVAGWYHLLGKLTEVSFGDLNDEDIQEITATFTAVIGYTAASGFDYTDYNSAMTTTKLGQWGYDSADDITATAIVAADLTSIISGNLTEVGTASDS
jgi:hypothetical protein